MQILGSLRLLEKFSESLFWETCWEIAKNERCFGLLNVLAHLLLRLPKDHRDQVRPLIDHINQRGQNEEFGEHVRESTIVFYIRMWLFSGDPEATKQIDRVLDAPVANRLELRTIVVNLGMVVSDRSGETLDSPDKNWELAANTLSRVYKDSLAIYRKAHKRYSAIDPTTHHPIREAADILDLIIDQIWRGLISHEDFRRLAATDLEIEEGRKYIKRFEELITTVTSVPISRSAYELLGFFYYIIPCDPRQSLLWTSELIENAKQDQFQLDSMAAKRVVGLVEVFLADHKDVFAHDLDAQAALISILGTFVESGWANAQALIVRLDEVFRG